MLKCIVYLHLKYGYGFMDKGCANKYRSKQIVIYSFYVSNKNTDFPYIYFTLNGFMTGTATLETFSKNKSVYECPTI